LCLIGIVSCIILIRRVLIVILLTSATSTSVLIVVLLSVGNVPKDSGGLFNMSSHKIGILRNYTREHSIGHAQMLTHLLWVWLHAVLHLLCLVYQHAAKHLHRILRCVSRNLSWLFFCHIFVSLFFIYDLVDHISSFNSIWLYWLIVVHKISFIDKSYLIICNIFLYRYFVFNFFTRFT
jgi:hypothetical protein